MTSDAKSGAERQGGRSGEGEAERNEAPRRQSAGPVNDKLEQASVPRKAKYQANTLHQPSVTEQVKAGRT